MPAKRGKKGKKAEKKTRRDFFVLIEKKKKLGHKCRFPFIIGAIQTEKDRIMK